MWKIQAWEPGSLLPAGAVDWPNIRWLHPFTEEPDMLWHLTSASRIGLKNNQVIITANDSLCSCPERQYYSDTAAMQLGMAKNPQWSSHAKERDWSDMLMRDQSHPLLGDIWWAEAGVLKLWIVTPWGPWHGSWVGQEQRVASPFATQEHHQIVPSSSPKSGPEEGTVSSCMVSRGWR